jgi:hypothetical protein
MPVNPILLRLHLIENFKMSVLTNVSNSRMADKMAKTSSKRTKMDKHSDDVYPWDRTRGQANRCIYCNSDCLWAVCGTCRELIAQGKPPRKPIYRPRKKGLLRRHTFGGEVR